MTASRSSATLIHGLWRRPERGKPGGKLVSVIAGPVVLTGVAVMLSLGASSAALAKGHTAIPKPTVVLVHGAWADGSSWDGVVKRLHRDGYNVVVPPNPLRGLASDSAYLAGYLNTVRGPVVLAGHSYGGEVITNAATGNPAVKALVYVDAYIPDRGETAQELTAAMPGSTLDPATSFDFVPFTGPDGSDTDLYVKPTAFRAALAADLSARRTAVLAARQRPLALSALSAPSGPPAWKTIRSYAVIGTRDKAIPPAEQAVMAARAHATVVKIKASHFGLVSHPGAVARLIARASAATR
ncbi:MAG TPA: alpha/beta hydrolase [Miltoncostaeaceae bacterium]|jgi:pimeloyl-ACP methyl ester carboxylesterase|nr:alpha/beta hydrolase [Miltoncostaeaceae bacterium]